jgi:hypothetical protein
MDISAPERAGRGRPAVGVFDHETPRFRLFQYGSGEAPHPHVKPSVSRAGLSVFGPPQANWRCFSSGSGLSTTCRMGPPVMNTFSRDQQIAIIRPH